MKNLTSVKTFWKLAIVLIVFSSCKKSSNDSTDADPCNGITPVLASGLSAPAGDTMRLYASAVTGASYLWTGPNGFTSIQQNPIVPHVVTASAGSYKVTATVKGCSKESTVNLSTITYSTPACSPNINSYTVGSNSYPQAISTIDYQNIYGIVFTITKVNSLTKYLKLTFNENEYDMNLNATKNGVYKITETATPAVGYVQLVVSEDVSPYLGKLGFVCVQNGIDNWGNPFTNYVWCGVKVDRIGNVPEELDASGFGYIQ
jgi:hypothetical protein